MCKSLHRAPERGVHLRSLKDLCQKVVQYLQGPAALFAGHLIQNKTKVLASQQLTVWFVQVVGDYTDTPLLPLVVDGLADAPLTVGGNIDTGQCGIFPKDVLGDLMSIVVPVEARLKRKKLDIAYTIRRLAPNIRERHPLFCFAFWSCGNN